MYTSHGIVWSGYNIAPFTSTLNIHNTKMTVLFTLAYNLYSLEYNIYHQKVEVFYII